MTRKQSNNQWSDGIVAHPAPKYSDSKNPRLYFLGSRRNPPHWLSSKGPNYQSEYCSLLLVQLKGILKEKRRGKVTKGVLLLHDNATAHRALETQKKMAYLDFQSRDHPPSSPDLTPSDYHLFPGLKELLKGGHFSFDAEVIATLETWLDGQHSDFFFECLTKVRAMGWEVYWASWGVCWINPEFVRCSLLLSWSG